MNIGQDVRAYLLSKTPITNAIGNRIYPDFLPAKNAAFPAVVMLIVTHLPRCMLSGGAGWAESTLQLDIYSPVAAQRDSLAELFRTELQGFSGTMGSSTVGAVTCRTSRDGYEMPLDNSDTGLFRHSADYWIRHDQSVPSYS